MLERHKGSAEIKISRAIAPERPARERWRETMELRQRIGRLGLDLEDALTMKPVETRLGERGEKAKVDLSGLPPATQQAVHSILAEFWSAQEALDRDLRYLDSHYPKFAEKLAPRDRGRELFKARVGTRPVGEAELTAEGGLLVLIFSSRADFERFTGFPEAIGVYFGSTPSKEEGRRRHPWTMQAELVAVDASISTTKHYPPKSVFLHERQHFINHRLLEMFDRTQGVADAEKAEPALEHRGFLFQGEVLKREDERRQIKDEVLALFRQGRPIDASWAESVLDRENDYPFIRFIQEDERETLRKMLHAVESWAQKHGLFENERRRAFFVHQLYDVPLARFERYLRQVEKYFQEQAAELMDHEWAKLLEETMKKRHERKRPGLDPLRDRAWELREVFVDFTMGISPKQDDGTPWTAKELREQWEEAVRVLERRYEDVLKKAQRDRRS